jgi:hypothetical protein
MYWPAGRGGVDPIVGLQLLDRERLPDQLLESRPMDTSAPDFLQLLERDLPSPLSPGLPRLRPVSAARLPPRLRPPEPDLGRVLRLSVPPAA